MPDSPRIAVIGAGPIGLEAALYAALNGFDVEVYESTDIAFNVRAWGHVRLFSPFDMNASEWGRGVLRAAGHELPPGRELLTGAELVRRYLEPLSGLPQLSGRIHLKASVHSIGRRWSLKADRIGHRQRAGQPFRLRIGSRPGYAEADVVLDCSGTFNQPNWLGSGGIPCPGEYAFNPTVLNGCLETGPPMIEYGLPDILGTDADLYGDVTTLVVGSGYSAATSVVALWLLQADRADTRVVWLTRRPSDAPLRRIPHDPLPERDRLAAQANELATSGRPPVTWKPGFSVHRVGRTDERRAGPPRWQVWIESTADGSIELLEVDRIIANVGYRPHVELYRELQVHQCYATEGPMKLAAALLGETSPDCLAQTSHGPDTLRNPEPDFYILGSKSYGRDSRFLLRTGHQQIRDVFQLIATQRHAPTGTDER